MVVPPALKSRKFLLYWVGHLISFTGSQMQLWSLYWQVRTLTDEPLSISIIGLARFLPLLMLSLLAGVVADHFNRRKVTILTQLAQAVAALILGFTTAAGITSLWMLFGLVVIQAVAVTFDIPARQALIPALVPKQDLPSAYSVSSIATKVGGIIGPSLSGFVIVFLGIQWAYWFNAISFFAVIIALIAMGHVETEIEKAPLEPRGAVTDIQAGIVFIKNSPIILSAMLMDFFAAFFSSANTLLPFVATDILHVGPIQYGWLSSGQSIGTLLIALYLSQKREIQRQGKIIVLSIVALGFSTILFGISTSFWITMLALILIGVFAGLSTIIRNTVRQLQTPDVMRGRMMSITQIFFKGGPQLGEVESGLVAQIVSVPFAIVAGGIGCVIASWAVIKK
jgi:MFS family permease